MSQEPATSASHEASDGARGQDPPQQDPPQQEPDRTTVALYEPANPGTDFRVAVTMNGGISLAVYIGGVAHELNRLATEGTPLNRLAKWMGYNPVVDVIAGTSAGGINGIALALAQARGTDLAMMRDLWIELGAMESLLRSPFEKDAPSLLSGDYFLEQLQKAFDKINDSRRPCPSGQESISPPIQLRVTTTLLNGVPRRSVDAMGTQLYDTTNEGLFRFTFRDRQPLTSEPIAPPETDGVGLEPEFRPTTRALAKAARATASFPGAFEPEYLRVSGSNVGRADELNAFVDWAKDGLNRSRFVVDGGVLANTPTKHTLQVIRNQPAPDKLVRRVMLLVHPHADEPMQEPGADREKHPQTLVGSLMGALGAMSSLGSARLIQDVEAHNREALRWRASREAVISAYSTAERVDSALVQGGTSTARWALFRAMRRLLLDYSAAESMDSAPVQGGMATAQWALFRAMRKRRLAFVFADSRRETELPFATRFDVAEEFIQSADVSGLLQNIIPAGPPPEQLPDQWCWGFDLAYGIAAHLNALANALMRPNANDAIGVTYPAEAALVYRAAERLKAALSRHYRPIRQAWAAIDTEIPVEPGSGELNAKYQQMLTDYDTCMNTPPSEGVSPSTQVMEELQDACATVLPVITGLTGTGRREVAVLAAADGQALLRRLLTIEILSYVVSEYSSATPGVPTTPVELYQISAQVESPLNPDLSPSEKLAGLKLNRFGGFLKASWRANDWIWGRLDTTAVLLRALVSDHGIVQVRNSVDALTGCAPNDVCADRILNVLVGDRAAEVQTFSALSAQRARAKEAVSSALGRASSAESQEPGTAYGATSCQLPDLTAAPGGAASGPGLDAVVDYLLALQQCEIMGEEAGPLLRAIDRDKHEGAISRAGEELREPLKRVKQGDLGSELAALDHFSHSQLGGEPIADQARSDLFMRTASTAAATGVSVLTSNRSGLTVMKPVTMLLRGVAAVLYWIVGGLSTGGTMGRFIAGAGLALGVGLTAVGLISGLNPGWSSIVTGVGLGLTIAVLAVAALRTGTVIHSAALLGLYLLLIPLAIARAQHQKAGEGSASAGAPDGVDVARTEPWSLGVLVTSIVVLLIVGALVIGNLNQPNQRKRSVVMALLVPVVVLAVLALGLHRQWTGLAIVKNPTSWTRHQWNRLEPQTWGSWTWVLVGTAAAGLLVLAAVIARRRVPANSRTARRDRDSIGWAFAYSVFYLAFAVIVGIYVHHNGAGASSAIWAVPITAGVIGVGFGLLAPWLISRSARKKVAREAGRGRRSSRQSREPFCEPGAIPPR